MNKNPANRRMANGPIKPLDPQKYVTVGGTILRRSPKDKTVSGRQRKIAQKAVRRRVREIKALMDKNVVQ